MRYEYECLKDGTFEKDVPLKDFKKKQRCPKCKKLSKKVIKTAFPKSQTWQV